METPQDIFNGHISAISTCDINIISEDYVSATLFITPEKTYKSKADIKEFYKDFLNKINGIKIITTSKKHMETLCI